MEVFEKGGSVVVKGVIKTIDDIERIKSYIDHKDYIDLVIEDSFAMPSALIGHLIKLKQKDNKQIVLKVGSEDLYELLTDLDLGKIFNIVKL
jgi:hypothetical protein